MNDNDHVRAVRNAALAVADVEKTLAPLYEELRRAIEAAEADGLKVQFPPGIRLGTEQPRISREIVF